MPFFSRNTEHVEPAPVVEQPPKKHGLFSHREPEPVRTAPVVEKKHGLFGSRNRSVSPAPTNSTRSTRLSSSSFHTSPERDGGIHRRSTDASGKRSLLQRFGGGHAAELDPSIVQARERVMGAEVAEREADRALIAARDSARAAREHVKALEIEAQEEARRAKVKQYHAHEVSKRGKQLGRK